MRKSIITFTALFLLASVFIANAQATEKTLTKSFNLDGKKLLRLELPGSIDIKTWDNPVARFEILVSLPQGISQSTLDELANAGRYNLLAKSDGGTMTVTAPNLYKQIRIKGQELKEVISFVVYVPKDCQVEAPDGMTAALKR